MNQIALFALDSICLLIISIYFASSDKRRGNYRILALIPAALGFGFFAFLFNDWFGGINVYSIASNLIFMLIIGFGMKNLSLGDRGFFVISLIAIPALIVGGAILFGYMLKPRGRVPFLPLFLKGLIPIVILLSVFGLLVSVA